MRVSGNLEIEVLVTTSWPTGDGHIVQFISRSAGVRPMCCRAPAFARSLDIITATHGLPHAAAREPRSCRLACAPRTQQIGMHASSLHTKHSIMQHPQRWNPLSATHRLLPLCSHWESQPHIMMHGGSVLRSLQARLQSRRLHHAGGVWTKRIPGSTPLHPASCLVASKTCAETARRQR